MDFLAEVEAAAEAAAGSLFAILFPNRLLDFSTYCLDTGPMDNDNKD